MSANAYNIARRLSVKNENDLLQEDMMEVPSSPASPHSKKSCFEFMSKAFQDSPLPLECERYDEIKVAMQRRNTDPKSQDAIYAGMSHGDRVNAVLAREQGHLNHHQIQRRMTTSTRKNKVWSGSW